MYLIFVIVNALLMIVLVVTTWRLRKATEQTLAAAERSRDAADSLFLTLTFLNDPSSSSG